MPQDGPAGALAGWRFDESTGTYVPGPGHPDAQPGAGPANRPGAQIQPVEVVRGRVAVEPGSAGAIPVRVVAGGGPLGVDAGLVELAAGGRIVGAAYPVCGAVVDENGIYRLVYRASGDPAGAGDNELVAARGAGIRIRVLSAYLLGTAAVNGILRSATTAITGTFALTTPLMLPHNPHGWCQTAANEALNLNLSGAVATGAILTWVEAT